MHHPHSTIAQHFSGATHYQLKRNIQKNIELELIAQLEMHLMRHQNSQKKVPQKKGLEIGCAGTHTTHWLLENHYSVTGIDNSGGQLARAKSTIPEHQQNNITFVMQNIENFSSKSSKPENSKLENSKSDEQYQLILSSMSLHWATGLPNIISSLTNALAQEGSIAIAIPLANSLIDIRNQLQEKYRYQPFNSFPTLQEFREGFGFDMTELTITTKFFTETFPSWRDFFSHFQTIGANTILNPTQPLVERSKKLRMLLKEPNKTVAAKYQIGFAIAKT